ncbi:MAG TPA: hypothetical protein VIK91_02500 [Nannocystis sp.]
MHSRNVEIKSPCHESWDAMHGDEARRFCDVCAKHVHNLSAMTRQEAVALLQRHRGEHLCVRYASHEDGTIAFRDAPVVPIARLRAARTAFAAVMLAACTPHGDSPPIQNLGDVAIEVMARDARPSPEGGCEVQTGPLTTLHFPPGHAVCRGLPDLGARVQPPPPPVPPPPPEPVPLMGGVSVPVDPPEPPGALAPPEPQPRMGEAVPDLKEPCDPPPGFAPPPPPPGPVQVIPPPEMPGYLMGEVEVRDPPPPPPPPRQFVKMGKVRPADHEF